MSVYDGLNEEEEERRRQAPSFSAPITPQAVAPEYGNRVEGPTVPAPESTPPVPTQPTIDEYLSRLNVLAKQAGVDPEQGWRQDFENYVGRKQEKDVFDYHAGNMARRAASTNDRTEDSQSAAGNALYGSGTGNGLNVPGGAFTPRSAGARVAAPAFQNTSPLFDDPASRLIEDYALDQFGRRQNPDPNSGTAMFEQYARELIDTLKQAPYTQGDEAIIKTQATNAIMTDRDQTRQRWTEEMSRRGIPLSSGPALEGLMRIDQHFQGLKTTVDANFAREAIDRTRQQRTQVLATAGQLADSEEGRLREALTYASLPKQIQDNAFQQGLQLVGAGGNPQSMLNSALSLFNSVQSNNRLAAQDRADSVEALMEVIAGLGYGLTQ